MKILYNFCAPLPFNGQKRRFAGKFAELLAEHFTGRATMVVDLFGGSGLLSRVAKDVLPAARVVYNDYDNYAERLANTGRTNALLRELRDIVLRGGTVYQKRLPEDAKRQCVQAIRRHGETGYTDFVTISRALLFSNKNVFSEEEMEAEVFYNRLPLKSYYNRDVRYKDGAKARPRGLAEDAYEPYDLEAAKWLEGLERTHCHWRELYMRYKDEPGAVFVADPPYVGTRNDAYSYAGRRWSASDGLAVLDVCRSGRPFFYFISKKSLERGFEDMARQRWGTDPLAGCLRFEKNYRIGKNAETKDIMYFMPPRG